MVVHEFSDHVISSREFHKDDIPGSIARIINIDENGIEEKIIQYY